MPTPWPVHTKLALPAIAASLILGVLAGDIARAAEPLAPRGTIGETRPTFSWSAENRAKAYLLELKKSGAGLVDKAWVRSGDGGCANGGTCRDSSMPVSFETQYQWRLRTFFNSGGKGPWTSWASFNVKKGAGSGGSPQPPTNAAAQEPEPEPAPSQPEPAPQPVAGQAPVQQPPAETPQAAPAAPPSAVPLGAGGPPAIPQPLGKLVTYHVKPSGDQRVRGGGNEDLLLVSPAGPIDGRFKLEVEGFRGVYWIGGTFNVEPRGWLASPNGRRVEGVGKIVFIRTHPDPVSRPFIVIARMDLQTDKLTFGDFLQLGGKTRQGDWQAWPDVYRCNIRAEPLVGWSGYKGGSFSKFVSHSDFTKFDAGGVRHSYAAKIDVTWGYQHDYVLPSWSTGKKPYKGPDGRGSAHYWNYVARVVTDPSIRSKDNPKAFFLARGSNEVEADRHITYTFHDSGKGVWIVPKGGSGAIKPHVHPGGGSAAPRESNGRLVWPTRSGTPFVKGVVRNGGGGAAPAVVGGGDVGWQRRVTNRAELQKALATACR